jgi:hypothetical protein
LSFFSFDSHDNPLSYEISPGSGHRDYVSVRIRYDLDEPVPFTLSLKHYDNEVSLNLTGKALSDFTEANVIRLELPLSDRRRAFPEIRPQNKVFKDIIAPCISTIRREQQRAVSQALERERKHQAYLTKLKAQYEMQCERWGNWYRNCYQRPNCSVPFAAKPNSSSEYSCERTSLVRITVTLGTPTSEHYQQPRRSSRSPAWDKTASKRASRQPGAAGHWRRRPMVVSGKADHEAWYPVSFATGQRLLCRRSRPWCSSRCR